MIATKHTYIVFLNERTIFYFWFSCYTAMFWALVYILIRVMFAWVTLPPLIVLVGLDKLSTKRSETYKIVHSISFSILSASVSVILSISTSATMVLLVVFISCVSEYFRTRPTIFCPNLPLPSLKSFHPSIPM